MTYTTPAGRLIHAAYYTFADGTSRVVWFNTEGNHDADYHQYGECRRWDGKPVIVTKPGESLLCGDVMMEVVSVSEYPT
jgi:hypothetical protein